MCMCIAGHVSLESVPSTSTQITIYRQPTAAGSEPIYNQRSPSGGWNSNTLLTHFSHANWSDVCLAHLFISEQFSDGRLGVAYIASPTEGQTGGICSRSRLIASVQVVDLGNCDLGERLFGKVN